MKLYSTKNKNHVVSFEEAVFKSLPQDNGLYMPCYIDELKPGFLNDLPGLSFQEIALEVASTLLQGAIEETALKAIIEESVNFPAPVVKLEEAVYVLELFHGPSMAFKDFGARFMSRVMAYFLQQEKRKLNILVATSGDTGGAVAMGFYDVPNIEVTILYPSGKVSPVQEKQLTTLGKNITALEIAGSFDDCQRLVKQAFLDEPLNGSLNLSSANSINIARLIPQTFYYFNAYGQLRAAGDDRPLAFSVPSGNFGNLTAGLIAQRMGLPVAHFIASTNTNDEVPQYLEKGIFEPRSSKHTLSNAMDVGNPSNFARMQDIFCNDVDAMRKTISGYSFTDADTLQAIDKIFRQNSYIMCPHTAIAYAGLKRYLGENNNGSLSGVFLSTAHPCKFPDVFQSQMLQAMAVPDQIGQLEGRQSKAISLADDYAAFKAFLLDTY